MCYVKKYDVGQIKVDLPYANYIHELPLLSIGDVKHNINLSLVFNYNRYKEESENGSNPFFIAPGYKLNLQKRLTNDDQGNPTKAQEANGEFIDLNRIYADTFTFRDESQRILRIIEHTIKPLPGMNEEYGAAFYDYEIESPDFSKEKYDESRKIVATYDKYGGTAALTYGYNSDKQLTSVKLGDLNEVTLEYVSNRLGSISYGGKPISFCYDDAGMLKKVEHYSGDVYEFTLSEMDYTVKSKENNTTVVYSKELRLSDDNKTIKVSDKIGDNTVNTVSYSYPFELSYEMLPYSYVDTIDNNGVKTRTQFLDGKATCSYEINDQGLFGGENCQSKVLSNVTFYKATRAYDNFEAIGVQTRYDGSTMNIPDSSFKTWSFEPSQNGYYILSGWIKPKASESLYQNINIGKHPHIMEEYDIGKLYADQWKYFSIMFYSSGTVYVNGSTNNVFLRDLRLTFQGAANTMSEYVLFNGNNKIPFHNVKFYYTNLQLESPELPNVTFSDVLRCKLRKKKYGMYDEYYSENCTNVLKNIADLRINYDGSEIAVSDLDLGIKSYSDGKEFLTRINIDESDQSTNIVKIHYINGSEVGREILSNKLDIVQSTQNGVVTSYERNSQGLVTSESVSGLYKRNIAYSDDLIVVDNIDPDTNDILSTTKYHIDTIWGGVTKVEVLDENGNVQSVIKDTYDPDMSTLLSRAFDDDSSRESTLEYSNGRVSAISSGDIEFKFGYTNKGELESISKGGTSIEHHTITRNTSEGITTIESKYPSEESALKTVTSIYDKYGRLKKINGQLENVYDFYPSYIPTDDCPMQDPNSCAVLKKTIDLTTGEVHEYGYDNKYNISQKQTKNSSGTVISTETFEYDNSNRLTSDNCTYDTSSSKSVGSAIEYVSSSDNRIKSYSFKVNGTEKVKAENSFDAYKRLNEKRYTVGGKVFSKDITYNKTKLERVEDKCGDVTIADTSYEYDCLGRIKSINNKEYIYDEYGQQMEEKTLDKTIKYTYNGIGNIESVNYYSGNSSTPDKTETYGYSGDGFTSYNGKAITYNSNGEVTTYDGCDYSWSKGKLSTIYRALSGSSRAIGLPTLQSSQTYSFGYNGLGQRVSSSYNYVNIGNLSIQRGELTAYSKKFSYDHSGRLIYETNTKTYYQEGSETYEIVYLYDENSIIGMVYTNINGTNTYYFLRNLQGDVVAIYDTNGNKVVGYTYDAWGNCTIDSTTTSYDLAHANPIRYRGYYYDEDTKLYYLNSRYYSPEWRRFISPDDTAYLDPKTPNGLNLYCYCNNDPINFVDPSGHFVISSFLIGLGIAAAIGAGVGAASYTAGQLIDYTFTGDFEWSWGGFAGSTIGGALGGMVVYSFNLLQWGMVGVFVSGFSTTAITMVGENITNDASHTSNDIFTKSFVDGLFSIISSGVMKNIKFVPINSGRGSYSAISKQMYTKITNGTITRISAKTLGKMFISEFYDGLFGLILN